MSRIESLEVLIHTIYHIELCIIRYVNKLNTMQKVTIVFTEGKHPFIHKRGYHTQGYIKGYMPFVQVVKMEPANQK
jgi:hypothetical protein